ncbi:hypothetical protein [Pseudoalteromonas 'SMAR']|uniref:hypothetical protein n=1 Tax=Pseudoalteromonas 'SMAR' TaxID=3416908 RepID=UPI003AF29040
MSISPCAMATHNQMRLMLEEGLNKFDILAVAMILLPLFISFVLDQGSINQ